ncbi:hypothetical protein [Streptomyces ehimensis]|uniref:Uncharacterized protein n=1 Tax=Streptomyces ehimensis TaxID=68195 RepID=A0ABV9BQK0_9ACTN
MADTVLGDLKVGSVMSWDVLLLPLPAGIASIDELGVDHELPPVGSRFWVLDALQSAVHDVDLTDSAWGELVGPSWVIELSIGEDDPVESVMLHVRGGGDEVLPVIFGLARALGCRVLDSSSGDLLAENTAAGWHAFQGFRDRVVT